MIDTASLMHDTRKLNIALLIVSIVFVITSSLIVLYDTTDAVKMKKSGKAGAGISTDSLGSTILYQYAAVSDDNPGSVSESTPASLTSDIAACIGSGSCHVVDRPIFQKSYSQIIPEYVLQLRPELCLEVNINDIANQIQAIPGVALLHVYELPGFQAVAFRGYPGPELVNDDRFVDLNGTLPSSNAEYDESAGHTSQTMDGVDDAQGLEVRQTLPTGLQRTILNLTSPDSTITDTAENVTSTNMTLTNASSLAPSCQTQRVVPVSTDVNMSAADFNVDIAVLDTGVSLKHPDLNVYRDVTFINGTATGDDDNGHGSHVAGVAAAKDNDIGIVGIAPGARIWAIKVCDASGECKITDQIKGLEYAIQHADEIDVLNISIENPDSPALNNIINAAVQAGITVVASAGNQGKDAMLTTPANNPNVMTVSAIGDSDGVCGAAGPELTIPGANQTVADDTFAFFSNFGPSVKIAAPGVNILSTYNGTGYAVDSGTSMAAPYVTGAAALYKAQHPYAMPSEVMDAILGTASNQETVCDNGAHGYFTGDVDSMPEPLLYREQISVSTIAPSSLPITPVPLSSTS